MTTLPNFTPAGVAPNRNQGADAYVTNMNAKMAWDVIHVGEANVFVDKMNGEVIPALNEAVSASGVAQAAAAAAAGATSYSATSTSSINMSSGSGQTLNLAQTGKGFAANTDDIVLIRRSDADTRAYGHFSAFNSGTGAGTVVIDPTKSKGVLGTYSDWLVIHAGLETVRPAFEAELKAFAIASAVAL